MFRPCSKITVAEKLLKHFILAFTVGRSFHADSLMKGCMRIHRPAIGAVRATSKQLTVKAVLNGGSVHCRLLFSQYKQENVEKHLRSIWNTV
jgi:hypothetical protein